ncbi:MAG: carbohydrate-binding protein [Syntrophobacteraceae bacterium]
MKRCSSFVLIFAILFCTSTFAADDGFYVIPVPVSSMTFKGEWNISTAYAANDVVFHQGSSWISLAAANSGNEPGTSPSKWTLLAQKGDTGAGARTVCSDYLFAKPLEDAVVDILSVSISVPGPGRVYVSGTGTFSVNLSSPTQRWEADAYLSDTSEGTGDNPSFWGGPVGMPEGAYRSPFMVQQTFTVPAAGTYTYYLTGIYFYIQSTVYKPKVCAIYTPD